MSWSGIVKKKVLVDTVKKVAFSYLLLVYCTWLPKFIR